MHVIEKLKKSDKTINYRFLIEASKIMFSYETIVFFTLYRLYLSILCPKNVDNVICRAFFLQKKHLASTSFVLTRGEGIGCIQYLLEGSYLT